MFFSWIWIIVFNCVAADLFSGRIVMGLFGKAVPKTAGKLLNVWFIQLNIWFMISKCYWLLHCFLFCVENFRALCTGKFVKFNLWFISGVLFVIVWFIIMLWILSFNSKQSMIIVEQKGIKGVSLLSIWTNGRRWNRNYVEGVLNF